MLQFRQRRLWSNWPALNISKLRDAFVAYTWWITDYTHKSVTQIILGAVFRKKSTNIPPKYHRAGETHSLSSSHKRFFVGHVRRHKRRRHQAQRSKILADSLQALSVCLQRLPPPALLTLHVTMLPFPERDGSLSIRSGRCHYSRRAGDV